MKSLLFVFLTLGLVACAPASKDMSVAVDQAPMPVATPTCQIYDACTYSGGFISHPLYTCTEVTYQASVHPEINSAYFGGHDCLTTREDYQLQPSFCGPMNFPCQISVQGPGLQAIPAIGL